MRNKVIAVFSTLTVLIGLGWYSLVHAQTAEMARHEPHMSAALGHLQKAKVELEKAAPIREATGKGNSARRPNHSVGARGRAVFPGTPRALIFLELSLCR